MPKKYKPETKKEVLEYERLHGVVKASKEFNIPERTIRDWKTADKRQKKPAVGRKPADKKPIKSFEFNLFEMGEFAEILKQHPLWETSGLRNWLCGGKRGNKIFRWGAIAQICESLNNYSLGIYRKKPRKKNSYGPPYF